MNKQIYYDASFRLLSSFKLHRGFMVDTMVTWHLGVKKSSGSGWMDGVMVSWLASWCIGVMDGVAVS